MKCSHFIVGNQANAVKSNISKEMCVFNVLKSPIVYCVTPNRVPYHYMYYFISASRGHIEINTALKVVLYKEATPIVMQE